jgi:hypothetical protein
MPSADHLGAKIWIKNPDAKVPSSHSAPPHLTTQSQKTKLIKYVTISSANDISSSLGEAGVLYLPANHGSAGLRANGPTG